MSKAKATARRVRVERNIYRRQDADGHVIHEVGYRDSTGRQRWRTVEGGIMAARAARDDVLGRKGRGERVQPNPRLRFGEAADAWLAGQVAELRPATQAIYTNAIETHLASAGGDGGSTRSRSRTLPNSCASYGEPARPSGRSPASSRRRTGPSSSPSAA